jgi:hypothetical protein
MILIGVDTNLRVYKCSLSSVTLSKCFVECKKAFDEYETLDKEGESESNPL